MMNQEKTHQFLSAYEMIQLDNFSDSQFDEFKLTEENVHWFETCDSTSNVVKEMLAKGGLSDPIVCISDVQTAGKGQRDSEWRSVAGNLHFSMYLPISKHIAQSKDLTMIDGRMSIETAIALLGMPIMQTAKLNSEYKLGIKWPNDLCTVPRSVTEKQEFSKFSGVLIEPVSVKPKPKADGSEPTLMELPRVCGVIIGLGMNANDTETTHIEGRSVNNLQSMLNHTISLPDLAAQACQACQKALDTFIYHSSSLPVRFFAYDLLYDKPVSVKQFNDTYVGIATGIQADGALTVMENIESTVSVYDGKVTLTDE